MTEIQLKQKVTYNLYISESGWGFQNFKTSRMITMLDVIFLWEIRNWQLDP